MFDENYDYYNPSLVNEQTYGDNDIDNSLTIDSNWTSTEETLSNIESNDDIDYEREMEKAMDFFDKHHLNEDKKLYLSLFDDLFFTFNTPSACSSAG